jgi:hypothetical protein
MTGRSIIIAVAVLCALGIALTVALRLMMN